MPKISVIIPVYGVEKYLRECLDSILAQTFNDIEIILIDDGSKDNCPAIIDEYAALDKRIKAIHKKNGGYGAACNTGLKEAAGEYISIIEPDDYIAQDMYKDLYEIAQKYNSDIVKSPFYDNFDTKNFKEIQKVKWNDNKIPQDKSFTIAECPLFLYYHPSIWSCIYKREFLETNNIKFVEAKGAGWTDNPFQVETMCLAKKINYTNKAYYYWRRTNEFDSDDLKDWTLPFKRSDEIHNWLKEKNITNPNILSCLFARELAYINIVLDKKFSKKEFSDVEKEIKKMLSRMNEIDIQNLSFISKRFIKQYNSIKNNLKLYYFKRRLKKIKKSVITLKISKEGCTLRLFGKRIINKSKQETY